jgi:TatD DNase family protein
MLFDTHTHYDDKRFNNDRKELLSKLPSNNVSLILNVGADIKGSIESVNLAKEYPFVYAAVGVHPHSASEMKDRDLELLEKLLDKEKVVALGEIGLDYHYEFSPRDIQKKRFLEQLEIAKAKSKPVVIHSREAASDTMQIIKSSKQQGVFHCFGGSLEMAKELVALDYYISFTGVITFSNAKKFEEIIKYIPLDKILIETDCPYLAPEPYRGQRNSSLYVYRVAEKIAEIKGLCFEEIAKITMDNGKRLFSIV